MKNDFTNLQLFVDEMKSTSSSNKKKEILQKWKDDKFIMKIILYVNNPYWTYGVTSTNIQKFEGDPLDDVAHISIFDLLDDLRDRNITGHNAIRSILSFIETNEDHEQLILNIIDKDIETRANASLINKVIPNYIPEFKVALANTYEEKLVDFDKEEWYASRKLDGVRCICRIENGAVQFFSRTGKDFETLSVLEASIKDAKIDNIVLDGEICLVDDNGKEDFQGILKAIRKKDGIVKNPKFFIFDALTLEEFDNKVSSVSLVDRQKRIPILKGCEALSQFSMCTESDLSEMQIKAEKGDWEGVMLRKNTGYKGRRSNDLLKVKKFKDAEYEVISTINDNMRFFEEGKDVERETMAAVMISHKGFDVKVGSGFSKVEREFYYNDPSQIIGKLITVQYFQETTNQKDDSISLRFPTFKCVHGKERVV
jgi:DNA ligase-1